jgi:hypothetical protein
MGSGIRKWRQPTTLGRCRDAALTFCLFLVLSYYILPFYLTSGIAERSVSPTTAIRTFEGRCAMKHSIPTLTGCVFLFLSGISFGQESRSVRGQSPALAADPRIALSSPSDVNTIVPHLIKFSGILQDLSGKPMTGPVDVTFSLYSEQAGGSPLWFETQTVQASSLGHYTVLLGAMTPAGVPMELFTAGEARWLGVQVSNLPEQPRVLLVSVPYAMKAGDAETLGGKPASAFMLASQAEALTSGAVGAGTLSGLVQSRTLGSTRRNAITQGISTSGTANYIAGWAADGTTLGTTAIFQDPKTNNIGIGTTTPAYGLDINANVIAAGTTVAKPGFGGALRFRDDTGTPHWLFGILGTSGAKDFNVSDMISHRQPFVVQTGAATNTLVIGSNGSVGIGTASPFYPLDINANVIAVGTTVGKPGFGGSLRFRDDTGTPRWLFGLPGSSGATKFRIMDMVSGREVFAIEAGAPVGALYVNSSGNVGIGTAGPGQKLSVAGTIESTSGGFKFPDGSVQTKAATGSGAGTITGVAAGAGLSGGGTTGNVTLSFQPCTSGQVLQSNGTGYVCATVGNGVPNAGVASFNTRVGNVVPTANDYDFNQIHGTVGATQLSGTYSNPLTFTGDQTITGSLVVGGTVNGVTIVPDKQTSSCTISGTPYTSCKSANVTIGFWDTSGKSKSIKSLLKPPSGRGTKADLPVGRPTCLGVPDGGNCIADNVIGGTITGGGGMVGGYTYYDTVSNHWATVAGGAYNNAGDGKDVTLTANCCQFVGGGNANNASGNMAVVSGGFSNYATGAYATVPGGNKNTAGGQYSFAAGRRASAGNDGAFVWGDSTDADVSSTVNNQFVVRATGGVKLLTDTGLTKGLTIDPDTGNVSMSGNLTVTGTISGGGGGTVEGVTSFNGRVGAVLPANNDYAFVQLSGTLGSGQLSGEYSNKLTLSNTSNSFTGDGSGLTNVNAAKLNGIPSSGFASTLTTNNLTGDQNITGNLAVSGNATAQALAVGSTTLVVDSVNKRVGVGTTTPTYGLDVNANVIGVGTTVANPGFGGNMRFRDDTGKPRWLFGLPGSSGATKFRISDLVSGREVFTIEAGAPVGALYVNAAGNVGVGTVAPAYALDVAGTGHFSGALTAASFTGDGSGLTHITASNGVTSFNGRTGAVVPATNDYAFSQISGTVTNSQLVNSSVTVAAGSGLTGGGAVSLGGGTTLSLNPNISAATGAFSGGATGINSSGSTYGVYGTTSSTSGVVYGVYGSTASTGGGDYQDAWGVYGGNSTYGSYGQLGGRTHYTVVIPPNIRVSISSPIGVYGSASSRGVYGETTGSGDGVYGYGGTSTGYGVYGSGGAYAGYFSGNVNVTGTLTSGVKDFKIDHPLDPANKYLYHSSVESSEMMNIYTGNVILSASGEAMVELPDWFQAENTDFRYQLTAIGAPAPGLYIAEEIANNQFKIAGGRAAMKVSWQVTAVRQDAYAKSRPLQVEVEKPEKERGTYIHPELFGALPDKSIEWARHPEAAARAQEMRQKQE